MSTRISSLSIRTTVPSTTSPCLKLLMSESCSASSSSIVVGSGPRSRTGRGSGSSSSARRAASAHVVSLGRVGGRAWPLPSRSRSARRRVGAARRRGRGVVSAAAPARSRRRPPRRLRRLARLGGDCLRLVASRPPRSASTRPLGRRSAASPRLRPRPRPGARMSRRPRGSPGSASATRRWRARRRRRRPPRCSGAWSVSGAIASGSGAVPPCFSSVKGYVLLFGRSPRT